MWGLAAAAVLTLILVIWRLWPSPPPPCTDLARERQQVQDIVARGQNSVAAALAESVLGQQNPPPCPDARRGLAALWYAASIEDLLNGQHGDQITTRWLAIEERAATAYGLSSTDRMPPVRLAERAYRVRLWPLADAALRRAWADRPGDIELVAQRFAVLRNWGGDLAFRGSSQTRAEGERLLATAQVLARAYKLPHGEACQDLQSLGYVDCNGSTPDLSDPMLTGLAAPANRTTGR